MLESRQAAPDGVNVRMFEAGQAYDLDDITRNIAAMFIAEGWAQLQGVDTELQAPVARTKPDKTPSQLLGPSEVQ